MAHSYPSIPNLSYPGCVSWRARSQEQATSRNFHASHANYRSWPQRPGMRCVSCVRGTPGHSARACSRSRRLHIHRGDFPGFRFNTGAIELEGIIHSGVDRELGLENHGLRWVRTDHLLAAHIGDRTALFHRDLSNTIEGFRRYFGDEEATEWGRFAAFSSALMSAVGSLQHVKSPGIEGITGILDRLGEFGDDLEGLIRTVLAPSCIVIDEWLRCPEMRAAAAAFSSHPQMPPWAPGSGLLTCLLASSHGVQGARPLGGTGELIQALLRALAASGADVKCDSQVREILVQSGRVAGVALESGEKIEADNVVSTIDVKRVAEFLPEELLTAPWKKAMAGAHSGLFNVGEIKIDAALDRPPAFRASLRFRGLSKIFDAHAGRLRGGDENRDWRQDSRAAAAHGGYSLRGRPLPMPCWKSDAVGVGICSRQFSRMEMIGQARMRRQPMLCLKRSNISRPG